MNKKDTDTENGEKDFFLEINTFRATFLLNFPNFAWADQFF